MKKLRMIVTSVVVLAIVGGAFAFKTKAAKYCVKEGDATNAGNCTALITNFKFTTDALASQYYIYPFWDGITTHCTQDAGGNCTLQKRLTAN